MKCAGVVLVKILYSIRSNGSSNDGNATYEDIANRLWELLIDSSDILGPSIGYSEVLGPSNGFSEMVHW